MSRGFDYGAPVDWSALLWKMVREPDACPELSFELDGPSAISRFVDEAPPAARHQLCMAALEVVLRGTPAEVANLRRTAFETAANAVDVLEPLVRSQDPRLAPLGGPGAVLLRLACADRRSSRLGELAEALVAEGARSPELTEALANVRPEAVPRWMGRLDWPESAADVYVILALLPADARRLVFERLPDTASLVAFAQRVGDPQGVLAR